MHCAAQLAGRSGQVAGLLGSQALLDGGRQFGLPGVVRHLIVDLRSQIVVVRPDGLDHALGTRLVGHHQLHAGRQLFLADRLGRQPDRHVVVAFLVTPGAGREVGGQRVHRLPLIGQILHGGRDLPDEEQLRALRHPDPQVRRRNPPVHCGLHDLRELGSHHRRLGDDVEGAHQGARDLPHLTDHPVGADTAAVALKLPDTTTYGGVQLFGGLMFVGAVGQQQRVLLRHPAPH